MALPKLGSGARFATVKGKLAKKGVKDSAALAASIGRKKFGKAKFQGLAAKGKDIANTSDMENRYKKSKSTPKKSHYASV